MNLDKAFRQDSKARRVAEALLTGAPATREELAEKAGGVAVTTVNRVVEVLEELGATVVRETADDGRQAVFRVTGVGEPARAVAFPRLREETRVVGAELIGDALMVDFSSKNSRYRGVLKTLSRNLPLGRQAEVVGVAMGDRDTATVTLATKGEGAKRLTVEHVQNVTEPDE